MLGNTNNVEVENDNHPELSKEEQHESDEAPIKIRVIGGWMRRDVDEDSERENKSQRMWHGGVDRNMEQYDNRNDNNYHFMTDEEIIKKKGKNVTSTSLSTHYKNGLIETAMELTQPIGSKKKLNTALHGYDGDEIITSDAYNSNARICHLPLEDGGMRSTCVAAAIVPRSLHFYCDSACAYCMTKIPRWKIDEYEASKSGNTSAKKKKKRSGRKKRKDESSSDESEYNEGKAFDVLEKNVGILTYHFHRQCLRLSENENSLMAILNDGEEMKDITTEKCISLKGYHENKSIDDVICDLCGRSGGVMQYF